MRKVESLKLEIIAEEESEIVFRAKLGGTFWKKYGNVCHGRWQCLGTVSFECSIPYLFELLSCSVYWFLPVFCLVLCDLSLELWFISCFPLLSNTCILSFNLSLSHFRFTGFVFLFSLNKCSRLVVIEFIKPERTIFHQKFVFVDLMSDHDLL